ncbi:MAG: 2-C-methyl-D-erythritol 4-phosphate cytidylyltransferase [Lachnospiraceae bacterium]|nr:2-C-methyl-D-erythritol 4-phosphate cytidylyltransferase [Lachnospiraceae bacterium]
MYQKKRFTAVVLAGGSGKRMETDLAKQYMKLNGYPMLYYALLAFEKSRVDSIVLVTGKDEMDTCQKEIVEKYGFQKISKIVAGGKERYHSSALGLAACQPCDYVLIHDGARPCLSQKVIQDCMDAVLLYGACTAGVQVVDTICRVEESQKILEIPNRSSFWSMQTPQCFVYDEICFAHQILAKKESLAFASKRITDDVRVIQECLEREVYMVVGSYDNIKVTTASDIEIAERLLKQEDSNYEMDEI